MRISFLLFTLFIAIHGLDLQLLHTRRNKELINNIFRDITKDIYIIETIVVMSNFSSREDSITDSLVEISLKNLPMNYIASNNSNAKKLHLSSYASAHTLLIYIYQSKDLSEFMQMENITYTFRPDGSRPKVLFLAILEQEEADFKSMLAYMWTKYILDVTVLQVSRTNTGSTFILHQYNPFTKIYLRQAYSSGVDWFPNKVTNLHGYKIKMYMSLRPGYNSITRNSQGYVVKFRGPDYRALCTLKDAMNFTISSFPKMQDIISTKISNGTLGGVTGKVQTGEIDVILTTLPFGIGLETYLSTTQSFTGEKWCVLMPILYKSSRFQYGKIFMIIISAVIVIFFWLTANILKFQSRCWSIHQIFRMMINISVNNFEITLLPERILYIFLTFVSAMNSSNLYGNLAVISLSNKVEVVIKEYEDLLKYKLTPIFRKGLINITMKYAGDDLKKLKDSAIVYDTMKECGDYLMKHKNVSCFIETNMATAIIFENRRATMQDMKVNENLCFWSTTNGFYFYKYSPYIEAFSDILLRSLESGIRDRWFIDYYHDLQSNHYDASDTETITYEDSSIKVAIYILLCGHCIALLTFFAEHIIHRFKHH